MVFIKDWYYWAWDMNCFMRRHKMKRICSSLLLALVMLLALAVPAAAAPSIQRSGQTITVDGVEKDLEVYNIYGSNYFKLRDLAALLAGTESQFSVDWDADAATVTVLSGRPYVPVGGELETGPDRSASCKESAQTIIINGRKTAVTAYNLGNNNFFKLRELGALLGFGVYYDGTSDTAEITSKLSFVTDLTAALASGVATRTVITPKVDGKNVKVHWYVAPYTSKPNRAEDQLINIYIPEGATRTSPIIFYVGDAGWQGSAYPTGTVEDGRAYTSYSDSDSIGEALKEGYVIVSCGCRGSGNGQTNGEYLGHSPAAVTDIKAAIRYLRANASALPSGDAKKIVITGTSDGGALATVIAASGNSPDYFQSLYEIGAAGIIRTASGRYVSDASIGDNVYGVIAYCPITDPGSACAAYEWTFGDTRKALAKAGEERPAAYAALGDDELFAISDELKNVYARYIDDLGLVDENGSLITSDNLASHIAALMEKEISLTIEEMGTEQMKADITGNGREDNGWVTFNGNGSFSYDYSKHLYYLAKHTALKVPSAFSNYGLEISDQNEDKLFGTTWQEYCPFNQYSWNNDRKYGNGVGKDDTGLAWDAYMATDVGKTLARQIRMTSTVDYLLEGTASVAPYWYVRHGMDDRDTSFAAETVLYYSALNNAGVNADALNFGFAWLQGHAGNYDVWEAYDWLKDVLS